jgi:hypothetical protein
LAFFLINEEDSTGDHQGESSLAGERWCRFPSLIFLHISELHSAFPPHTRRQHNSEVGPTTCEHSLSLDRSAKIIPGSFGPFWPQNPMTIHPLRVWTEDNSQELAELVSAIFHFIEVQVIPNTSQCRKEGSTSLKLLGENRFYLLHLLNVLGQQKLLFERLCILQRLSAGHVPVDFPGDCHITMISPDHSEIP